jgi:transcriptional regulator with XRE-family HTH domain
LNNRKTAKPVVKPNPRATGSLDIHFGEKLQARRLTMVPKLVNMICQGPRRQFPAVQKYEAGTNRISAATMVQIAAVLRVDVQYFFDELPTGAKKTKEIKTPVLVEMSLAAQGPRLIDAFLKLKTDKLRGIVADLAQVLAQAG